MTTKTPVTPAGRKAKAPQTIPELRLPVKPINPADAKEAWLSPSTCIDSELCPETEPDRGRKRSRRSKNLEPTDQSLKERSGSRLSSCNLCRSLSRDPSAHTGVHYLASEEVKGAGLGQSKPLSPGSQSTQSCHFSYEDQKHICMMRWLEASHK